MNGQIEAESLLPQWTNLVRKCTSNVDALTVVLIINERENAIGEEIISRLHTQTAIPERLIVKTRLGWRTQPHVSTQHQIRSLVKDITSIIANT